MGPPASRSAAADSDELKSFLNKGASMSLPKHSYWFDFWVFVIFDIALVLFLHLIVP